MAAETVCPNSVARRNGVSVITPSFNQGSYIADCINSVWLQAADGDEHIIVDAGSTDDTLRTVSLSGNSVRLILEPGCSQSAALNIGISVAKNPIIAWLNSDDILLPGSFDEAKRLAAKLQPRFYLYSGFVEINSQLQFVRNRSIAPFCLTAIRNYATYIPTSGSYFSSTVASDGILLDRELDFLMDRDFIIELSSAGYQIVRSNQWLACFRVHSGAKSVEHNRPQRRVAERARLTHKHGGLYVGRQRFMPPVRALSAAGHLYIGGFARFARILQRFSRQPSGAPTLREINCWLRKLQGRRI